MTKTTNSGVGRHMVDYSPQDVESRSGRHQRRALSGRRLRNTTLTGECTSARFESPANSLRGRGVPENFRVLLEKSPMKEQIERTEFKYYNSLVFVYN